jgi:hypothetical protein
MEGEKFIDEDHSDSNMVVAIRVRPISVKEVSNGDFETITIQDKLLVISIVTHRLCTTQENSRVKENR